MKVVWTPAAKQDRADIWDDIAAENSAAAADMDTRFSEATRRLALWPQLGKAGEIAGTREVLLHRNYRLVYEIREDTVIWLGLMRDRLDIIRRLLAEDGSLWITIDDNEAHYLKVMCDEVFGRENFVSSFGGTLPKLTTKYYPAHPRHLPERRIAGGGNL